MRQAAQFFVNGNPVGKYENGVTACGLDITDAVHFGEQENVLTVKVTNVTSYREEASGVGYQWASRDFNPNFGGLNRDVWLHVMGKIHQTLPLYENLKTSGVYGRITLSATRAGLEPAKLQIESRPVAVVGGLLGERPQILPGPLAAGGR